MNLDNILNYLYNKKNKNILVFGDYMLDASHKGSVDRIAPDSPVPIIKLDNIENSPGGAGNVCLNLSRMGNNVFACGMIGNDSPGLKIKDIFLYENINIKYLFFNKFYKTIVKNSFFGSNAGKSPQKLLRVDDEDNIIISANAEHHIRNLIEKAFKNIQFDMVYISDYNKNVCTESNIQYIIGLAKKHGVNVIVDPHSNSNWECYKNADYITPNRKEAQSFTRIYSDNYHEICEHIHEKLNINNVYMTADKDGAFIYSDSNFFHMQPLKIESVYDVTGAGDTYASALCSFCNSELSKHDIGLLCNISSHISIQHAGTHAVSLKEIINYFEDNKKYKVKSYKKSLSFIEEKRKNDKTIVMTNGCFDLLHPGHIEYLDYCSKQGDVLVVAINDDDSIRKIKSGRPINNEKFRTIMLSLIDCIDCIFIFDGNIEKYLQEIKPDIYIKGADYNIDDIRGKDIIEKYGGKIMLAPYIEEYSSTKIIERIKNV